MWIQANSKMNFLKELNDAENKVHFYMINTRKKDDANKSDRDKDVHTGTISHTDEIETILKQYENTEKARMYIHVDGTDLVAYHVENIKRSADYLKDSRQVKINPFSLLGSNLTKKEMRYQKLYLLDIDQIHPDIGGGINKNIVEEKILQLFQRDFIHVPELIDSYLTRNGMHMIFTKFDTMKFQKKWSELNDPNIEIGIQSNTFSLIAYTE